MRDTFDVLILIARPAAGKSELVRYLWETDRDERIRRFHIGDFDEIDDFPMLWVWFEEDRILEDMGKPRIHTTPEEYFKFSYLWDLLIRRMDLEYAKKKGDERITTILEFSRGSQHGGYRRAFQNLSDEILARAAVLYINVSYEESVRKNRLRYNPLKPYSILEHALPDDKMETLYRESDWEAFSAPDDSFLYVGYRQVPYGVLENEDDVTTTGGEPLGSRLEEIMHGLWERYRKHVR